MDKFFLLKGVEAQKVFGKVMDTNDIILNEIEFRW